MTALRDLPGLLFSLLLGVALLLYLPIALVSMLVMRPGTGPQCAYPHHPHHGACLRPYEGSR